MKKMAFVFAVLGSFLCFAVEVKLNDGYVAKHSGNFAVTATENGFTAKVLKSGPAMLVSRDVKFPAGSRLHFAADIKSNMPGAVMLNISQPDASKKASVRTYQSRINFAPADKLVVESDVRADYKSKVMVRIDAAAKNGTVTVSNMRCYNPSGSGKVTLEVAPSYVTAGYELSDLLAGRADEFSAVASFRENGGEFQKAFAPDYPPLEHKARGVLVNLKEDTEYELKLEISDEGKKSVLTKKFRTLGKKLPVAKTVVVTQAMVKKGLVITQSGTPDGYIRYTSKPGVVLKSNGADALKLNNVKYIIIDGLTIRGGKENGIRVTNSCNIVIRNCDIASFGRLGTQNTRRGGEFYSRGRMLNSDAGIWLRNVKNILIENNFIHDTNGIASPWFYSHPAGPKAINAGMVENATVRYNDFIGGDIHRWNDAVECMDNSGATGGFYRNAEIYGNLFALSNDDGIELEGGEINCRFFGNRIENTLCGVSSGSCARGPSYIYGNLFWRGGDVHGLDFNAFKNGHGIWNSGKVFFFNNTATGYRYGTNSVSGDTYRPRLDKMVNYNNIYALKNEFGSPRGLYKIANCAADHNLIFNPSGPDIKMLRTEFDREHNGVGGDPKFIDAKNGNFALASDSPARNAGRKIDNFTTSDKVDIGAVQGNAPCLLPLRKLPFVTSTAIVRFAENENAVKTVVLSTKCPKAKVKFNIAKTIEADWLKVTPASGVITKDKPVTLKVSIDKSKFKYARVNNTVFLVRTCNGVSRPVSVEADSRTDAALLKANRRNVLFSEVKNSKKMSEFIVDVPADGYYFVMLYGKVARGNATVICDGKELYTTKIDHPYQQTVTALEKVPSYFNLCNWGRKNAPVKLSAGKHKFTIKYNINYAPERAALIQNANELMHSACVK
ncbi:MAG: right-handed parallel beta-helix repeat-containing protein [Lentisphaeria bacterium]|nr:right-handed parallel beta-helix repeat-containing protein [Lentisphaeria bacterium]